MTKWEKLTQRLVFHADEISSTSNRLLPDAQDFYARFVQHVLFDRPLFVTHPRIAEAARVAGFTRVMQTATSDAGLLLGLCAYNWPPS
ncbi:MAG: hypothetical protein LBB51_02565 [Zoogloeaceae bacterium]|jgi:hypothetical protein|nr:hypothetical protein [Zoogloeaceae bacterium]